MNMTASERSGNTIALKMIQADVLTDAINRTVVAQSWCLDGVEKFWQTLLDTTIRLFSFCFFLSSVMAYAVISAIGC